MENFMYTLRNIWSFGLLRFVVFIVLAFVAAKVVSSLVSKLLKKLKLDEKLDKWGINEGTVGTSLKFVEKLIYLVVFLAFLPGLKTSAAKVLVNVVKAFLVIFIAAQSIQSLDLPVFAGVASELIYWLPILVKAALIILGAFVAANLVEGALSKCCTKAAKAAVFTVAGFMTLSQLGIASAIVEKVFVLIVAALAVAFAIAFGLGGKEYAAKVLKKIEEKKEEK